MGRTGKRAAPACADSIPTTSETAVAHRVRKRWLLPTPPGCAPALAAELGVPLAIACLLARRGLTDPASARGFLQPELAALHAPTALLDMDRALERLQRAIRDGEKIRIHGDYDVDGITSTVILKTAIEMAGGKVGFTIPHRLKEGYGIQPAAVDLCAEDGVTLIISVDTGIRAAEVVRRARALNIDAIITDHHLPEAELPDAVAVINPNRPGCSYPNKDLCGVGVAYKLVEALLSPLGWEPARLRRILGSFLKLVAIGTVADVVPLTGENRIIVSHGLAGLRDVRNPGLRALFEVAKLEPGCAPTARQIGFRVAPRINAAGRMASASDAVELFLTQDPARAHQIATQLHELNTARQAEEAAIVEAILEECARQPIGDAHFALVFCAENWHRGVLGIVASRLVDRFHRPAFVLGEQDGVAQGSGRSIAGFHLLDALDALPGMFVKYGGHSHAAGLTMRAGAVGDFRDRFNAHARSILKPEDLRASLAIDAMVSLGELDDRLFQDLQMLEPFGAQNPEPLFAALDVEVAGPLTLMKEKHVRVPLRQGGRTVFFKGFHFAERAEELRQGARIDVAFTLEEDRYRGGWSAVMKDIR
jgi:single-stranded-DNA-specific exonuclease